MAQRQTPALTDLHTHPGFSLHKLRGSLLGVLILLRSRTRDTLLSPLEPQGPHLYDGGTDGTAHIGSLLRGLEYLGHIKAYNSVCCPVLATVPPHILGWGHHWL